MAQSSTATAAQYGLIQIAFVVYGSYQRWRKSSVGYNEGLLVLVFTSSEQAERAGLRYSKRSAIFQVMIQQPLLSTLKASYSLLVSTS